MSVSAPSLRIRGARRGDAAAIARVHVDAWRAAYAGTVPDEYLIGMTEQAQAKAWRRLLAARRRQETVLVAEVPGGVEEAGAAAIVGFGSCGPQRMRALLYSGEVYTLYVAPDWQGEGIGRRLLAALFRRLYENGVPDAVIWVLAANPARFFYEAMGGQRVAERQDSFAGAMLEETAYAWPDLEGWLAEAGW